MPAVHPAATAPHVASVEAIAAAPALHPAATTTTVIGIGTATTTVTETAGASVVIGTDLAAPKTAAIAR